MTAISKHYCDGPSGQVHYRSIEARRDCRQTLLCLHPAPSSGLYFTTAMPLLNESRRVVAPDYPGYGASDSLDAPVTIEGYAAAMLAALDALALDEPVDLLGFHTGCLVACEMALAAPGSFRRLVLCDVPYFEGVAQSALREKMSAPLPVAAELDCLSDAWHFNVVSRLDDVPLERALEFFAEHLRAGVHDADGFVAAFSYDCVARFSQLDADVTVLATRSGLHDATLAAAAAIDDATLVEVTEISAAVFESGAQAIAKRILAAVE